jgi:uncharacterized protein YuzE
MQRFKFDYDEENDDLFIYNKDKKSSASVEIGKLVLDFDKDKKLTGIEIMDAVAYLSAFSVKGLINKELLENIFACEVGTESQDNILIIKLVLSMKSSSESIELPINMTIPRITRSSPALTCH